MNDVLLLHLRTEFGSSIKSIQIKSNLFAINKVHNITVHKNYISLGWTGRRQLRTYVCPYRLSLKEQYKQIVMFILTYYRSSKGP